jgi:hypothetical protein
MSKRFACWCRIDNNRHLTTLYNNVNYRGYLWALDGETRNVYRILVGDLVAKWPLGGPKRVRGTKLRRNWIRFMFSGGLCLYCWNFGFCPHSELGYTASDMEGSGRGLLSQAWKLPVMIIGLQTEIRVRNKSASEKITRRRTSHRGNKTYIQTCDWETSFKSREWG